MARDVVRDWTKIFASNNAGTSVIFTPTGTLPSGVGVIDLAEFAGLAHRWVMARFWGAGSNNNAFDVAAVGIKKNASGLYAGLGLMKADGTLGQLTGVADFSPLNTELWADTLAAMTGTGEGCEYYSGADDGISHVVFDTLGHNLIKFLVNKDAATSINGEYCVLSEA